MNDMLEMEDTIRIEVLEKKVAELEKTIETILKILKDREEKHNDYKGFVAF